MGISEDDGGGGGGGGGGDGAGAYPFHSTCCLPGHLSVHFMLTPTL